jgi:hypothetical protein
MEPGIGKKVLGVLAGAATTSLLHYILPDLFYIWWLVGVMVCLEILSVTSHKQGALYGALVMDIYTIIFLLWYNLGPESEGVLIDPGTGGIISFGSTILCLSSSVVGAILGLIGVTLRNAIRKWRVGSS